jgi:hypothetical protein
MQMLRYVVLRHSGVSEPHFDLMFQTLPGSALATWRSDVWPIDTRVALTRLRDHRRFYLDYEGDLSDQRGTVIRVAEGNFQLEIGENSVWTIRIVSGATPQVLVLRQINDQHWEADPA